MTGALTSSELDLIVFILGVGVILGGAYVAYTGRVLAGAVVAVIGCLLLLLAS